MLARLHAEMHGLTKEQSRAVKLEIGGHESARDMTDAQIGLVLDHLRRKGLHYQRPAEPNERPGARQERLIWAIFRDLARAGAIDDPSEKRLRAFVKKTTGVDGVRWLTPGDANRVIEGLKAWLRRAREKASE
jgi:phage gp16-like protein